MNVDTMRTLDYYVGVPLCFFGTIIKKLFRLFAHGKQLDRPYNILFIELAEMGSVILADPAMMKLKRTLNADLYFVIFRKNSHSLRLLNTIPPENIFVMADSGLFEIAIGVVRFLFWTRKKRIDTVIDLDLFSRFTALLAGFSGALRTVGFHAFHNEGLYRGDFLSHKVAYNPHQHIAKNFVALVNALLTDKEEVPYSKTLIMDEEIVLRKATVREDEKTLMLWKIREVSPVFDESLHKLILFNTNSSDLVPLRRWPREYYIILIRMILDKYQNIVILLTGNETERPGIDIAVGTVSSERCLNFAGMTSIAELPALYSLSSFMLTNDSGPAHFASITDMPTFVFFGPEIPKLYGPLGTMTPIYSGLACSPCVSAANHRKSVCTDNVCLQVITPEQVLQILQPYLKDSTI
jgi:ADP-heptose:LPS heptosyltransferase